MRAAAKRMTDIAGESANIRSGGTFNDDIDIYAGDTAFFPFNVVSDAVRMRFALDLEQGNFHLPRLELHFFSGANPRVSPLSVNFNCTDCGGNLRD